MPEADMSVAQGGGGGSNNSSDFVRKLYKMLEDPAYSEVVRWGNEGDSFVVLENEKFTKTILPKHFKHSNFASFVRQLNKYDFHKVRQSDENGQNPYGTSAWEFKHPEFRADAKNNLDNIRRKAPAPRKAQAAEEQFSSNTQVTALSEVLAATQQQVQALQDGYHEMAAVNKLIVDELLHLQKLVKAQNQVHNEMFSYLNKAEEQRRQGRTAGSAPTYSSGNLMSDGTEEPSQELRRVREILNNLSNEHVPEKDLRQMSIQFQQVGASPDSAGSGSMMGPPGSAGMNNTFIHDPMNELRHVVYPVGQTIGIDPFAAEHMANIPYNRPLSQNALGPGGEVGQAAVPSVSPPGGASQSGSPWGSKKPRILLVEDDKTCSRIGSKFLAQYDCGVEIARDGQEAVNKVTSNPNWYDLIFMDIVMPNLDGVSATWSIKQMAPNMLIVAMTSNINQQDLETYFHYGMVDVLAKPFTKDGMIGKLKKHLPSFLRNPPPEAMMESMYPNGGPGAPPTPGPYPNAAMNMPMSAAASSGVKFETTPIQSPSTSASWHSPAQMPHASPNMGQDQGYLGAGSGSQMALTPGGTQRSQYSNPMMPAMTGSHGGRMEAMMGEGPPEKRQRLYGPQGTYAQ